MGEFTENLQRCPQLMIYLGVAFFGVGTSFFFSNEYFVKAENGGLSLSSNLFMHLFQIFIISSIFYYLCRYNYTNVAWVLLLFPVIISFMLALMFFGLFGVQKVLVPDTAVSKDDEKETETEAEAFKGFDGVYNTASVKI